MDVAISKNKVPIRLTDDGTILLQVIQKSLIIITKYLIQLRSPKLFIKETMKGLLL